MSTVSINNDDRDDDNPMPVWIDDCHLDPNWFGKRTDIVTTTATTPSSRIVATDISTNQGRLGGSQARNGGTLVLTVETPSQHPDDQDVDKDKAAVQSVVLKQIINERTALSRGLGLAREALFYTHLAPQLNKTDDNQINSSSSSTTGSLPKIYYAYGNMETGEKCVIMECLTDGWIDSGIFFTPTATFRSNPHNWFRDCKAMLTSAFNGGKNGNGIPPSTREIAKQTFIAIAQIHAAFWKNETLLDGSNDWLRAHAWIQGRGKESWEASQSLIQNVWKEYCSKERNANDDIQWDATVRQAVEKCVAGISWQAQLDRLNTHQRWTLVHGDFWPGNVLWNTSSSSASSSSSSSSSSLSSSSLRLIDWEMVGIGSGPQDLGQYVISNMDPADRRACEKDLIRAYTDELICYGVSGKNDDDNGDDDDLYEYCWKEYRVGGVERWLWFLVWFLGQPGLTDWTQFFHDQIAAFLHDHAMTAADLTQPRA